MSITENALAALRELNNTMQSYPFGWVHNSVVEELQGAGYIAVDRAKTDESGQFVAGQLTPEGTLFLDTPEAPAPFVANTAEPEPAPVVEKKKKGRGKAKAEAAVEPATTPAPKAHKPVEATPAAAVSTFKIDPAGLLALRGKTRGHRYPFDTLEVGELFFVPAGPDILRKMTAAARSATMRYATIKGTKTIMRRGEAKEVKDVDYTRKFAAAAVKHGEVYGSFAAPGDGAVGLRLPVS